MKSTHFKKLLCTAFMLVFIVGCGKENSSGGNKGKNKINLPNTDNYNVGKVTQDVLSYNLRNRPEGAIVLDIFNQALAWRNNPQEGQIYSPGFTRGIALPTANSSLTCKEDDFLFWDVKYCYGKTSETQQLLAFEGTPLQVCIEGQGTSLRTKSLATSTVPYRSGCNIGGSWVNYTKGSNVELAKILSLNNKNWSLHHASFFNGIYTLYVSPKDASGPTVAYVINTHYHSVYNPMAIYNLETQKSIGTYIQ
jgi:hypothetical protein